MQKKINILLIDDSEIITSALKIMLAIFRNKCNIQSVRNLKQADKIITKKKLDVVILDIQLSNGNSIYFLNKIKKLDPDLTLIVLTNYYGPSFLKLAKKNGADYFFDKSMEFDKILEVVRSKFRERSTDGLLFHE